MTRRLSRPLANAHWSLPAAIVASWCLVVATRTCAPAGHDVQAVLLTMTVLVTAWANHLRVHAVAGWRKLAKVVTGTLADVAWLVLAFVACMIPIALFLPTYDCMTPRVRSTEVLLSGGRARVEIGERAERAGSLKGAGLGVTVDATSQSTGSMVSDDGTIMVTGGDPLVVYVLQPTLADGHVTWHCTGVPKALVPGACR